jgi:cell division protein FtsI (penicillin-binding protein 3)
MQTIYNSSRFKIVGSVFILLYLIIIANLYNIQIRQGSFFSHKGNQQYQVEMTTCPMRAPIYDRNGQPLAINKESFSAFIMPHKLSNAVEVLQFLELHFPAAAERYSKNQQARFMYLKRGLSEDERLLIERSGLPDVRLLKEYRRFYPLSCAGIITGITDNDNQGLFGIELLYNNKLAGKPSTYILEKDARSGYFHFEKTTKVAGLMGDPIYLTIDSDIQFLAYEELKEMVERLGSSTGAVLILDPLTGDIIAMTRYPDFDPQNTAVLDLEKTKNSVVTEAYELGSVMKVFSALAALDEGIVTADELIDCENKKVTYLDGIRISTVTEGGMLTFSQVMETSNNIGISKIAKRLGTKLHDHYKLCGFGQKTGINFLGEQAGFINPPRQWSRQSIFSLSFGYEIRATLLQLARAFSVLATNGRLITPRLLMSDNEEAWNLERLPCIYSQETITAMREMLTRTIVQGTAYRAQVKGCAIQVLGKTGTAHLLKRDSKGKNVYDHANNIFTFVGLLEKDNYKRIIVTFIKESKNKNLYASTTAAPLFQRIAEKILIKDRKNIP